MEFHFPNLPDRTVASIFQHFTFEEIAKLRLVNRWFNSVCSPILNKTFLGLKDEVEAEISVLNESYRNKEEPPKAQLKYKVLQMLRSEIATLHVVCERYVKANACTFSGGSILDSFRKIIRGDFDLNQVDNPLESQVATMLFLMCEDYGDHFEMEVEPRILGENFCPWYGSKIVDLLDSFLNCNYHITATYGQSGCQISARYEVLNPESLSELKLNEFESTKENMRLVARYIRNQMRWHNFFFYIDDAYESTKLNKRRDKRFSKFCLNTNDVEEMGFSDENKCTKTFSRRLGNPCSKQNASIAVELQCGKNFVPSRLKTFPSQGNFSIPESVGTYDFLLTLKLVLPSDEKTCANETSLELYHSFRNCRVIQKSKEIPI